MANYYIATTDMTLEQAITNGALLDGEALYIQQGAVVTVTQTPSILMGVVTVTDGELLIDGTAIATGNVINFVGEYLKYVTVYGLGLFRVTGAWYSLATTDGTDNQSIGLATYFGASFADLVPAIWIETGRRLNFVSPIGVTPAIDDWVYINGSKDPQGRIVEVQPTYLVVKFLIGAMLDAQGIAVRKVVDNNGPDFQETWTATASGADVKEVGVYQEFGNCVHNAVDNMTSFGSKMGGFVFSHIFQATALTLGGATGGFKPPSGCDIRIPNVHFSTSDLTNYPLGTTYHDGGLVEQNRYRLYMENAGEADVNVCNWGSTYAGTRYAAKFNATFVGACVDLGSSSAGSKTIIRNCVLTQDPLSTAYGNAYCFRCSSSLFGTEQTDCLAVISSQDYRFMGAEMSLDVTIKNCIHTIAGTLAYQNSTFGYRYLSCVGVVCDNNVAYGYNAAAYIGALYLYGVTGYRGTRFKYSMTQDESESTSGATGIRVENLTTDSSLVGWEVLGNGQTIGRATYLRDSSHLKFRCYGRVTDKLAVPLTADYFLYMQGSCNDIDFARVFTDNASATYAELVVPSLTTRSLKLTNVSAKFASRVVTGAGATALYKGYSGGSGDLNSAVDGIEIDLQAVYGSHFHDCFRSDTSGAIFLLFSPESADTVGVYSFVTGTPRFSRDGDMNLAVGDVIEFYMPYAAMGHTAFSGVVTLAKGNVVTIDGTDAWGSANVTAEFQYDTGAGFNGTWLDLRTTANLTGIASMVGGVKLKVRLTCLVATEDINGLLIHTATTLADQQANLYPIDQQTVSVKVTAKDAKTLSVVQGARVYLEAAAGGPLTAGTVIFNTLTSSVGEVSEPTFSYLADQPVTGRVRKSSSTPLYKTGIISGTITSTGFDTTTFLVPDE